MSKSHVDKHFRNGCYWPKHTLFHSLVHGACRQTWDSLSSSWSHIHSLCRWYVRKQKFLHIVKNWTSRYRTFSHGQHPFKLRFKTPRFYVHMTVFWLFVLLIRIVDTRNGRTLFIIQNCSFEVIPLCALVARRSSLVASSTNATRHFRYHILYKWRSFNKCLGKLPWKCELHHTTVVSPILCPELCIFIYRLLWSRFSFHFVFRLVSMLSKDHQASLSV